MTFYPSADEVVVVHAKLIGKFGGAPGIRDFGALESAMARPRGGCYSDLIQEEAALWESLSQNHPFIDGNKRVAVTVMAAFLKVNGYRLEFDDTEAFVFLAGLYDTGTVRISELERWLRGCTIPLDQLSPAKPDERSWRAVTLTK